MHILVRRNNGPQHENRPLHMPGVLYHFYKSAIAISFKTYCEQVYGGADAFVVMALVTDIPSSQLPSVSPR